MVEALCDSIVAAPLSICKELLKILLFRQVLPSTLGMFSVYNSVLLWLPFTESVFQLLLAVIRKPFDETRMSFFYCYELSLALATILPVLLRSSSLPVV